MTLLWRGLAGLTVLAGLAMLLAVIPALTELPPLGGLALVFGVLFVFSTCTALCLRAARRASEEQARIARLRGGS